MRPLTTASHLAPPLMQLSARVFCTRNAAPIWSRVLSDSLLRDFFSNIFFYSISPGLILQDL